MDKTLFTEKIRDLGRFKRKTGGWGKEKGEWEDLKFVVNETPTSCPDCNNLEFWARITSKGEQLGWVRKCLVCKEKTLVKSIFTK
jgi:tRNA(Ile2) C34 agmatinyltransferase TiaS